MSSPKAILFENAEISSVTSRKDKSIGFRVETAELTDEHRAIVLGLHGTEVSVLVTPKEAETAPPVAVTSEKEVKSQSQRLYNTIFAIWKQEGEPGLFESFRQGQMEAVIRRLQKERLAPEKRY